ncbi:MAG: hypothetical protein JNM17_33685 [Archangium sp.]|nr:hypothetical protein [Archangium sp.]
MTATGLVRLPLAVVRAAARYSRPASPRHVLLVSALAVLGSACGDPSKMPPKFRLEGSLTQVMDLNYDEARILIAPNDVSLQFVRIKKLESLDADGGSAMQGFSEDYPLKIAYILNGDPPPQGGRIDLAEPLGNGQRGVFSRNVQGDPRNTFPAIVRGTISFDKPVAPASITISGDFHITFENGAEVASGRTVFSDYTAKVQ